MLQMQPSIGGHLGMVKAILKTDGVNVDACFSFGLAGCCRHFYPTNIISQSHPFFLTYLHKYNREDSAPARACSVQPQLYPPRHLVACFCSAITTIGSPACPSTHRQRNKKGLGLFRCM